MAGRITPEIKDRLLERVDIVDVVGLRVQLKKAGKEFVACCPFHGEKTPSFTVSPAKQFYHCFGCGAHGNAIDFLIEHDRLSFVEAVEELAHRVGLPLPDNDEAFERGPETRPLYDLLQRASALYAEQLRRHRDAGRAASYLRGRGLSDAVIEHYGLGFAPPEWDFALSRLGASPRDQENLIAAGLIVARDDGKRYDRFRDRIMFPIRDRSGRVIGFGGRVLGDGEPKYLNSPETAVFHKGRELYGLHEAARSPKRLLVVEGYMDVIALAQFGIDYAVATLGTATTPEHLKRLLRSAPELVFCFDGDRAGRAAAWKALKAALPLATGQQPIRFLFLPEGDDPDSMVRQEGKDAFEQRITDATLLSDFMFGQLTKDLDLGSSEGRARLDAEARSLIESMPAATFRDLLEERLARLVGLPARVAEPPPRQAPARRARTGTGRAPQQLTMLRLAIALLLDDPRLAASAGEVAPDWQSLDSPGTALLREMIAIAAAYPDIRPAALCERWRDTEQEGIVRRLSDSALIAHIPTDGRAAEFKGALTAMAREAERERRWQMIAGARASRNMPQHRILPGEPDDTN